MTERKDTAERPFNMYMEKDSEYFKKIRTEIQPVLPDKISNVLEIGCGTGATMRWLRTIRSIDHATGLELRADVAHEAASVFDEVVSGDIEADNVALPFQGYDVIIALDVLEHMVDPWRVVGRCHYALKPGGVMIASIPNVGHYSVSIPLTVCGHWQYATKGLLDRTHLRFFVHGTAAELMTCSGLVIERHESIRVLPRWFSLIPDSIGGQALRLCAAKVLNSLPGGHLLDYQFLICARSSV